MERLITLIFTIIFSFAFISINKLNAQYWQQLGDTPFSSDHTNGFGHGDKAYLIQGYENAPNAVWEYDAQIDEWTQLMTFPGPERALAIGDEWDGKYYYGFGFGVSGGLSDLWVFDPEDMSFTELPSCPCTGRGHPAFIAFEDKIYMGSGSSDSEDLRDWWIYDIPSQTWEQKQNIPGEPRHHPFFFESGDKVYVGGGHINNWLSYNINTETWAEIDNTPLGRVAGTQLSYGKYGLVVAGDDRVHDHVPDEETFMSYDTETNTWEQLPSLPNGSRWAPASFILDNELYFLDGLDYDEVRGDSTFWKIDLGVVGCAPAENLSVMSLTTESAEIFWKGNVNAEADTLKWRVVGESVWNTIANPQAVYVLDGLEVCQEYECVVTNACGSNTSFSETVRFTTDGCCTTPALAFAERTESSLEVNWEGIVAASEYEIRWKTKDGIDWTSDRSVDGNLVVGNLEECTEYEFQIKSICDIEDIDYSESAIVFTKGCGACIDNDYCAIVPESSSGTFAYIDEVRIENYVNTSNNNQGYGDFVIPNAEEFRIGESFDVTVKVGPLAQDHNFILAAWIDLDGDGQFRGSDMVIREAAIRDELTRTVRIPDTAIPGLTRMRISVGTSFPAEPCENRMNNAGIGGEIEEYCINLVTETSVNDISNELDGMDVIPNPFGSEFILKSQSNSSEKYQVTISNIMGSVIKSFADVRVNQMIPIEDIDAGIYLVRVSDGLVSKTMKVVKL